jgi:hypothetical protein
MVDCGPSIAGNVHIPYTVASRDVNFCYKDWMLQTKLAPGAK